MVRIRHSVNLNCIWAALEEKLISKRERKAREMSWNGVGWKGPLGSSTPTPEYLFNSCSETTQHGQHFPSQPAPLTSAPCFGRTRLSWCPAMDEWGRFPKWENRALERASPHYLDLRAWTWLFSSLLGLCPALLRPPALPKAKSHYFSRYFPGNRAQIHSFTGQKGFGSSQPFLG